MARQSRSQSKLGKTIGDRLTEFADDLESHENIRAIYTCRQVSLDLSPQPYDPQLIKRTRAVLSVSQGLFAQFLGVSVDAVQAWESGVNTPSDMACRFMDEIRHDPLHWQSRLRDSMTERSVVASNSH